MNPYNFVPLGNAASRKNIKTHENFGQTLQAGVLLCRITTLTDIFIAGPHGGAEKGKPQQLTFIREDDNPIIPGSSLKGVIRGVAEALSGSCLVLAGERRHNVQQPNQIEYLDQKRTHEYSVPVGFTPCGITVETRRRDEKKRDRNVTILACPACRMFGLLDRDRVHLGHINFSSARLLSQPDFQWQTLAPSGAPGPRHRTFYGVTSTGFRDARGRKFYYHQPQGIHNTQNKNDQNKTVETLVPKAQFEFTVAYENLSESELALLIFSLMLEEPMCHKIGMGKGLGLGSVQITIEEWQTINLNERYRAFNAGITTSVGNDLTAALQRQRDKYHEDYTQWQISLQALREIWTWNINQTRVIEYPSFMWFKDNSTIPLEQVPDDAGQYRLKPEPLSPNSQSQSFRSQPDRQKLEAEAMKKADEIIRKATKDKKMEEKKTMAVYANSDTEPKAKVAKAADGSWLVILPRLPDVQVSLITKSQYSRASIGTKIRVRVITDKNGDVVRAEEL